MDRLKYLMKMIVIWKGDIRELVQRYHGTHKDKEEFESVLKKHPLHTDSGIQVSALESLIAKLKEQIGELMLHIVIELKPDLLTQLSDLLWVCGSLCAILRNYNDKDIFSVFEDIIKVLQTCGVDTNLLQLVYVKMHIAMTPLFEHQESTVISNTFKPILRSLDKLRIMCGNREPNPEKNALLKWMNLTEEEFDSAVFHEVIYASEFKPQVFKLSLIDQMRELWEILRHIHMIKGGMDIFYTKWLFRSFDLAELYQQIGHFPQSYYLLKVTHQVLNEHENKFEAEELDWMKKRINLYIVQHSIKQLTFEGTFPKDIYNVSMFNAYPVANIMDPLYWNPITNEDLLKALEIKTENYLEEGKDVINYDESLADLNHQWIRAKNVMREKLSKADSTS